MAEKYRVEKWKQACPPNPALLRIKLEQEGFRVMQWTDRAGAFYGPHKHGEDQSHCIISGTLEITVNNRAFTLEAGDRDFMPADTYHTARVFGDEPVFYLIGEKVESVEKATAIVDENTMDADLLVGRMMAVEKIMSAAEPSAPQKKKRKRSRSKQKQP